MDTMDNAVQAHTESIESAAPPDALTASSPT
jgi:hypothetical protein